MLKYEGTDKIRDIKYEDGYVDKIYYDNNTLLVFTSDKEKTGVDEVLFKGRKLIDVTSYGKCIQTNLPLGYTQLEYIESTGTQYIDTGVNIGKNIQTKVKFGKTTNSFTKFGFIIGGGGHYQGLVTRISQNTYYMSMYNSSQNAVVITMPDDVFEVTFNTPEHKVIINNTDSFDLVLISPYEINTTIGVFNTPNTSGNIGIGKVYSFVIKDNSSNSIVSNLIPAKNASNIVGMYDTVSGQFFTNAGTGNFIAGPDAVPTPDTPIDIVCNNGVLKYGQYGKNLLDPSKFDRYTSTQVRWYYQDGYLLKAGKTYTFSTNYTDCYLYVIRKSNDTSLIYAQNSVSYTPTEDTLVYFRAYKPSSLEDGYNFQLELGSTATPYEPYHFGIHTDGTVETIKDSLNNIATAEMLLKVGDYQDVQSIIDGVVTRNVGVKVLDGTENWVYTGVAIYASLVPSGIPTASRVGYCTHFNMGTGEIISQMNNNEFIYNCETSPSGPITNGNLSIKSTLFSNLAAAKTWLAEQYAAGTPVTVIYPLAQAVTEQVAPQALNVQTGDNTVEVTQASVDNILLKVKYK